MQLASISSLDLPANDLIDLLLQSQKEAELKGNVDERNKLTDIHIKQIISDMFTGKSN